MAAPIAGEGNGASNWTGGGEGAAPGPKTRRRISPVPELYASLEKAKRLRDVVRSITEEKVFTYLLSQSTVEPA